MLLTPILLQLISRMAKQHGADASADSEKLNVALKSSWLTKPRYFFPSVLYTAFVFLCCHWCFFFSVTFLLLFVVFFCWPLLLAVLLMVVSFNSSCCLLSLLLFAVERAAGETTLTYSAALLLSCSCLFRGLREQPSSDPTIAYSMGAPGVPVGVPFKGSSIVV